MRKIAAALAAIGLLALPGCSTVATDPPEPSPTYVPTYIEDRYIDIHDVDLPDGRHVVCVSNKRGNAGGISCDWARARAK